MRYQFSDFELTTERYELRRNGIALHVEPLVFDLILLLLRSPGRVVSREEMVERIWRGFELRRRLRRSTSPVSILRGSRHKSTQEKELPRRMLR